jgi:bacteriophage HK97-gp10 putative tail-component
MYSISVPLPGFDDKTVKELKKLLASFTDAAGEGPVRGGILSEGDAAAYALVWEFGNARQTQSGPKTVLGTGPDGEEAWLSIQAPMGYIRVNEDEYIRIIEDQLANVDMAIETGQEILKAMKDASKKAAELIADIIRDNAPRDSGALRDSITPADPEDPDLAADDDDIELGSSDFHHEGMRKALKNSRKRKR